MGQHQGKGIGLRRTHVDEVDAHAVDLGAELRQSIEPRLPRGPVVLLGPVPAKLTYVSEGNPLGPVLNRLRVGPPSAVQPITKIIKSDHIDRDSKLGDPLSQG